MEGKLAGSLMLCLVTAMFASVASSTGEEPSTNYTMSTPAEVQSDDDEVEVKGRLANIVTPHVGDVSWNNLKAELQIDVPFMATRYDVLVDQEWVDSTIPRPTADGHEWSQELVDGKPYYIISLSASQTPTTLFVHETAWDRHSFELNINEFQKKVLDGETVFIPISEGIEVELDLVAERINMGDSISRNNQGESANVDYLYRLELNSEDLQGEHDDSNAPFQMVMSSTGIVGEFLLEGRLYSYTAGQDATGGEETINVVVSSRPLGQVDDIGQGNADSPNANFFHYPYDPPTPPTTRTLSGYWDLDLAFRNTFADWSSASQHVQSAMIAQRAMWDDYTGNQNIGLGSYGSAQDLNTGGNCVDHLQEFTNHVDNTGNRGLSDYFVLVTGQLTDCLGIAWIGPFPGFMPTARDNLNYGLDIGSYQGRSSSQHLGKLIAQEVGHNWGEPDHPCQAVSGQYSIMCDNHFWDDKRFWLHYSDPAKPSGATDSTQRIVNGTSGYD